MAYIIGIIIVSLFFLSLHYFTELTKQQDLFVSNSLLVDNVTIINFYSNLRTYLDYSLILLSQNNQMIDKILSSTEQQILEKNNEIIFNIIEVIEK